MFVLCLSFFFCLFVFVIWFCVHGKNHASLKIYPLLNTNKSSRTALLLCQIWLMQLYGKPHKTAVAKATLDQTMISYNFASGKDIPLPRTSAKIQQLHIFWNPQVFFRAQQQCIIIAAFNGELTEAHSCLGP